MKQRIVLLVSILIGVAAFLLTSQYLRNERDKLYAGAEKIQVIAAARDLPAGTMLQFEDLGRRTVYKAAVGENVFRPEDLNTIINKKLQFSLRRNDPLMWSYVQLPERGRSGLAPMINPGLRAISISVAGPAAVSGLVQPSDRVDILGTFTFPARSRPGETESVTLTVLQDVTVLATGQRLARNELMNDAWAQASGGYGTVTLEVTPREAELLVFAQTVKGQLTLSLRNPEDLGFVKDMPEVNFEHIESKLPELNRYRQQFIRMKKDL
ncbi:MAG TPA: Flp pilus assembly protein CpaB [Kiritimatiellia bacterium]|nr:Flp pilus assembly protein CpaB [Kiritimatiellia bacterium]